MKAAIYARVSTDAQKPDSQLADLRQLAANRGFELTAEFVDHGYSGARVSRPALDQMLAAAHKREFDILLVSAFDRLGRSTRHLLELLDELRRLGVKFISLREQIDSDGPLGQAMLTIISAIAQLERSIIRERIAAGLRRARLEGRRLGRKPLAVDVDTILADRYELRYSLKKIARIHGVSKTTIGRVLRANPRGPQTSLAPVPQAVENTPAEPAA